MFEVEEVEFTRLVHQKKFSEDNLSLIACC